jgi:phosphomannomutase
MAIVLKPQASSLQPNMLELKIGTSWVRGVVGDALTPELVVDFACAFGTWAGGGTVVIGRDTRRSSSMLRAASIAGLLSPGCEVVDLGVCPTPLVSFGVRELGASGGISITGSHNDARWNALKFIGPDGMLLNPVKTGELLDIYHASAFRTADRDRLRPAARAEGLLDRYIENLLAALDVEAIRSRRFKVALDLANGACGAPARRFLAELGCRPTVINEEPHGRFAHSPAPTPAHMADIAALVPRIGADLGAAINVDGDRIAFVTAKGVALSEEHTLPLAAWSRLDRRPGPIVTNLSTSGMVDELARARGQRVIRAAVGESTVMERGIEEEAVLAGEGSGGVGALPVTMTFDGLLTLAMVLEAMARTDSDLEGLVSRLPRLAMRKAELACPPDRVYKILESFRSRAAGRVDTRDGVRIEEAGGWTHVRASNTEPLLRVIVEATTEERAEALFDDAMSCAWKAGAGLGG